jgi:cytochrome c oxidase subunit 2
VRGSYLSLAGAWHTRIAVRREGRFDSFADFDFEVRPVLTPAAPPERYAWHPVSGTLLFVAALAYVFILSNLGRSRTQLLAFGLAPALALALVSVTVLYSPPLTQRLDAATPPLPAATSSAVAPEGAVRIMAIGHPGWWEFRYPGRGISTANQLIVPAGTPIVAELEVVDASYEFWAPPLFDKVEAAPGDVTTVSFTVNAPGRYGARCAQPDWMCFQIISISSPEFDTWVTAQTAEAASPSSEAARRGQQIFMNACAACHAIRGTQAIGASGPNLSHLFSRDVIAGGALALNAANLQQWVKDAPGIKPGTAMPSFDCQENGNNLETCLTHTEVDDVAVYLSTLE